MFVAEVTYPGTWIDVPDPSEAFRFGTHLDLLVSQMNEAAVALILFDDAQRRTWAGVDRGAAFDADWRRRDESLEKMEAAVAPAIRQKYQELHGHELPDGFSVLHLLPGDVSDRLRRDADMEVQREKWRRGELPETYVRRLPFMYARSFVYALDTFGNVLRKLAQDTGVPVAVAVERDQFYASFPTLVRVRNTAHHLENRSRGLDKNGYPMKLQPITNRMINAPGGGVLVLDSLNGNRFGCTMEDGHFGEVEVSEASLRVVQGVMQRVLNAFQWKGPSRDEPSR